MTQIRIVVVGSSNTDLVVRAPRLPMPGETVLGGAFLRAHGGKGANQAVAAARLGAQVTFVARLGCDSFGDEAVAHFAAEGLDTRYVVRDPDVHSGVALIGVDEGRGENSIIVAPGANMRLSVQDIKAAEEAIRSASVVVCQLEVPLETVAAALSIARAAGVRTILNPAPAQPLPDELLRLATVLTPNEGEAALLAGDPGLAPAEDARILRKRGVANVLVTLGSEGALLVNEEGETHIPGRKVTNVVDTTAAGDCFTGALAVAIGEGRSLEQAAQFAGTAAAISVTRSGAQPSLPTRAEVEEFARGGSG
jgi:ribokinase